MEERWTKFRSIAVGATICVMETNVSSRIRKQSRLTRVCVAFERVIAQSQRPQGGRERERELSSPPVGSIRGR